MTTEDYSKLGALFAIASAIVLFVVLVAYSIVAIFLMNLFEKAGVRGKWRAWVPIYNILVFAKLGDVNPLTTLVTAAGVVVLSSIPYVGPIVYFVGTIALAALGIMAALRIQAKLGKGAVWVVLFILLGIVWLAILAFDKSRWNLAIGVPQWSQQSLLADSTTWKGIPPQNATAAPAPQWPAGGQYPPARPAAGTPYPPAPPAPGTPYPPAPPAGGTPYPPAPPAPGTPYPPAQPAGGQEYPPAQGAPGEPPYPPARPAIGPQTPPAPPAPGPDTPDRGQSPQA